MSQFTGKTTSGDGLVVTTVLDTTNNLQTITIVSPGGQTATATQPGNLTRPSSSTVNSLIGQLEAAGAQDINLTDVGNAVRSSNTKAVRAAENATSGDITSPPPPPPEDTPVPDNPPSSDTAETASADTLGVNDNAGDNYDYGQSEDPLDGVENGYRESPVPPGAEALGELPPIVTVKSIADVKKNESQKPDLRVKILVPPSYLTPFTSGSSRINQLKKLGGILFPYTPSISFENKADYSEQKPLHTNYALAFYQRSYVTDISIQGDFTVENPQDAEVYLSTMHLLKALTKMRFGTDPDAGAAPPVCRLYAYGPMMLENVPVSITSYRVELPKEIDYYPLGDAKLYGPTMVPTKSVIAINCKIMYSRQELQTFSVNGYLNGAFIGKGLI